MSTINSNPDTICIKALRALPEAEPPFDITARVMQELLPSPPSLWQRLRNVLIAPVDIRLTPLGAVASLTCCAAFFLAGYLVHARLMPSPGVPSPVEVFATGNAEANFVIGKGLLVAGMDDKALSFFQKASQLAPTTPEYHFWRGIAYSSTGDFEKERTSYLESIAYKPDYLPAVLNLGNSYLQTGDYKQSLSLYKKVLLINPFEKQALYNLSLAFRMSGDTQGEQATLRSYLSVYRSGKRAFEALARLHEMGDQGYRAYQLGARWVILDQHRLLAGSDQAQAEEISHLVRVMRTSRPMQLHIVLFDPTGMDGGRRKASEIRKRITREVAPEDGHTVTSSWFNQAEPFTNSYHPIDGAKSILFFSTPETTYAKEQKI